MDEPGSLFQAAARCLAERDPDRKIVCTARTAAAWAAGRLDLRDRGPVLAPQAVGRPARPELVPPRRLHRRGLKRVEDRAAFIHAIAHIEFNAINLAWDAVHRFRGLPQGFYDDWVRVAREEAEHFLALRTRLRSLGHDYGDFPAHDGLWETACRTAHDPLARMALVPRVLEARGLDVTPGMIARFREAGDEETAAVLETILREEVGHVAAGSRWLRHLCAERGLDPEAVFFDLLAQGLSRTIRCPLHRSARLRAGFTERELERLEALCR
jgi:uncharacterized ferritin-like protein (DUF455 family)